MSKAKAGLSRRAFLEIPVRPLVEASHATLTSDDGPVAHCTRCGSVLGRESLIAAAEKKLLDGDADGGGLSAVLRLCPDCRKDSLLRQIR